MRIKTYEEIGKEFDDVINVNSINGVPIQYISKVINEMHEQRWVAIDDKLDEAIALYRHLKEHPEVINAPTNKGEPMCKICNKTAKQILEKSLPTTPSKG